LNLHIFIGGGGTMGMSLTLNGQFCFSYIIARTSYISIMFALY